ncbi:hypothetical protein [Pedobacter cryoconitis]|uniref:Uncharacterized protein n=1 Tax=Pedobacter cryoconitis TaxID=188932 RepID=A0A7X0J7R8_9SPHI|nr:hypothetical protein [Pedobacter cryoconitis]MBB6502633.1 hypothetical protein [Pedobacter cryoconitis]
MEIKLTIPEYSDKGLQYEWENGFEIKTRINNGEIIISANKAGLISLAKQMLTLAQDSVPIGYHMHFDEYNSLEEESVELIIEKRE